MPCPTTTDMEPDLQRLAALLDEARLAMVVRGSHFAVGRRKANRVLASTRDSGALAELRSALGCTPRAKRMDWMTPGEPTIALLADGHRYLAAITVVGHDYVRSPGLLAGDVPLVAPERLMRWLALVTRP